MTNTVHEDFHDFGDVKSALILYASLDEQVRRRASVKANISGRLPFAFVRCVDGRNWSEEQTEEQLATRMIVRRLAEMAKGRDWLTRGAIACAVTHRQNLIGNITDEGKILCEDDAILDNEAIRAIGSRQILIELERLDGVTLLNYRSRSEIIAEKLPVASFGKYTVHRVKLAGLGSAACYFVPSRWANSILKAQTPISYPVDHWDEMVADGVFPNLFVVHARPARIGDFPSTIEYGYTKKKRIFKIISEIKILRRVKQWLMVLRGDFNEQITTWVDHIDE
jgi:hypothetical protein